MDGRLFSLVMPPPPGFAICHEFVRREFRTSPFALLVRTEKDGRVFLGDLLPKLSGIVVTVGVEPAWTAWHDHFFHFQVSADALPHLAPVVRPVLHLLEKLRESADEQTLLQLELKRAIESRNRMVDEFDHNRTGLLREIDERRQAQRRLEESEGRLSSIYDASPDGILVLDLETGRFVSGNARICQMLGCGQDDLPHLGVEDIHPPEALPAIREVLADQARGSQRVAVDIPLLRRDGSRFFTDINAQTMQLGGRPHLVGLFRDATARRSLEEERRQLQDQLLQSRKMESVGRLAGGVAHDFNNMLGVIIGFTDLLLSQVPPGAPTRHEIEEIRRAAQRSAELTRQLLAFARKQPVMPRVLDLRLTVDGMLGLLGRLIGPRIHLSWTADEDLWPVRLDITQVNQVLTNLCVNARDALGGNGRIELEAANLHLDPAACAAMPDAQPGDYVRLRVCDEGEGMSPEVLQHLFEPFFTTKELGRGTGMGLATVYGIVRQNKGFIVVKSAPGQGTCVDVHLPRHAPEGKVDPASDPPPGSARNQGAMVLLVEDEPRLLAMCRRLLDGMGCRVLAAGTPGEALRLAQEHNGHLHLLVTDVMMPEMNGRELADKLHATHPKLRCLFMSGYSADVLTANLGSVSGCRFLQKPFSLQQFSTAVRQALDEAPTGA
jgi:PAS domain S-box-containing protein